MAVVTLVLVVAWVTVVAVVPTLVQARRGNRVPPLRTTDRPGSAQWWARLLSAVAFAGMLAGPIAELAGLPPWRPLDHPGVRAAGIAVALLGIAATLTSQLAMKDSWRGDVDPDQRTPLVTGGPFRLVRNPVLTATGFTAAGLALTVPNPIMAVALVLVLASHQLLVRRVEEPHLRRVHGPEYARYAARTGRFVPWAGRSRSG
ncbi:methyltransferase family protein [Amycolatopsis suaedae]|uniref:Isoprenylcysteine carboxylmethyltransferase family protein n=1 Tax=Amycolatopsis suaedae TaxID=2510978 RepID=A0A4Q7J6H6_9PSEU|nr:isoprenylcysteine carboxylmethyltransferase family protein [Amycolatopsis suaedae]RZQ62436.1 isoprenylcysteine carboxylmethyltransferase family protein [Amycolatopsis suaedae]